jgi:osmotically-inducible protein OsmY
MRPPSRKETTVDTGTTGGGTAEAIEAALKGLRIDGLRVDVVGDCVYLHGQARCYETKRAAGDLAGVTSHGVRIANEIRVVHADDFDDHRIRNEVEAAIRRVAGGTARVMATVHESVVTLTGVARDPHQRHAIEAAVWETRSVARVHSRLDTATEHVADSDVAAALNEYVQRAMNLPPGVVVVDYRNGVASLSGEVDSGNRAEAIEDLVRWHDRVSDIVNNLCVKAPPTLMSGAGR